MKRPVSVNGEINGSGQTYFNLIVTTSHLSFCFWLRTKVYERETLDFSLLLSCLEEVNNNIE